MRKGMMRHLAAMLATVLMVGSVASESSMISVEASEAKTALTMEDVNRLLGETNPTRVSVHDPSVVKSGDEYYIIGSHMDAAKSADLTNWTRISSQVETSNLFAGSYNEVFEQNAYTGNVTIANGETVSFGDSYNAEAWIATNTVEGNMWAPDAIYNPILGKWCLYLSLNGNIHNSVIVLMTADEVGGPYTYQGPVVYTGFAEATTATNGMSYKDTDLELVLGELDELPEKYEKPSGTDLNSWGGWWPHAIDADVFYDEEGKLWMAYGSWSGGIYMLELDENTGLRDYTVTYASDYEEKGKNVTTDAYFGKKIAGGYYTSGEGPYIQKIGDYYYLFMSYGFYSPEGGYNMRIFRSANPDGPYTDVGGNSAIFDKFIMNYSSTDTANNRGMKLMGNYKWDTMDVAEVAQGHNSAFVDSDGKAHVVYHTKFADGTAIHEVRVHQLFTNEDGWLVAAPYEYAGETLSATGYDTEEVIGEYGMITHDFQIDYANLAYKTPEDITLNADGSITGAYTGTWEAKKGTPYVTLTIDGTEYKGVFTEQTIDGSAVTVMCFTAVSEDGVSIWGSGQVTDDVVVAQNVVSNSITIPANTYKDITLPTEGANGAVISWISSNPSVLSNTGEVTAPEEDTVVTLTQNISKGDYYFEKTYEVTVKAGKQTTTDSLVVREYYTEAPQDLSTRTDKSLWVANPFYQGENNGLDLSGGVTIEFDVTANENSPVNVRSAIFGFNDASAGKLYFSAGSYLGYNAKGGYFDANVKDWGLVEDYIGDSAHVAITLTADGFDVLVDGELAYDETILSTENGNKDSAFKDYQNILDWLYESADKLYFGSGSWWPSEDTIADGVSCEANVTIQNVKCTVAPKKGAVITDEVTYENEEIVLANDSDITRLDNPFYGKTIDNLHVEYTINMAESAAKNGWDGIFGFYESTGWGRISFQTAPYICYNDWAGNYMDINRPDDANVVNKAPDMTAGTEHTVKIDITAEGAVFTVDGEEFTPSAPGSGASYADLLKYVTQCDKLALGVGLAKSESSPDNGITFWNTEKCTLTDVKLYSEGGTVVGGDDDENDDKDDVVATGDMRITADEVVLATNSAITTQDNPFKGGEFDALSVSYTVNFSENAVMNGWDGLFSFYNTETGGRVSFQSAPYVCYNDLAGNYIDINQPKDNDGVITSTLSQLELKKGVDYDFDILITENSLRMFINGVEFDVTAAGSGATYADLLAFIKECDQFSFGVGSAQTAYWWTEMCTLKNVSITPFEPVMEKDSYTINASSYIEKVANPFYQKQMDKLHLSYTVNFADAAYKNGFDGLFSFYNSDTTGRVSIQSAPYICYNEQAQNWMDINQPKDVNGTITSTLTENGVVSGKDYKFDIFITEDSVKMYLEGQELTLNAANGSGATYADMLSYIAACDTLSFGTGAAETGFWAGELSTVSDLKMVPFGIATVCEGNGTATGDCMDDTATLVATPDEGAAFEGWYADGVLIGTEKTIEINACQDVTVTAKFVDADVSGGDDTPGGDNTPGGDDTPGGDNTSGGDDTTGGDNTGEGNTPGDATPCTHTWDAGVITTAPTATKPGVKTYTCTSCKTTKTEEMAAFGAPKKGATLKDSKNTAYYKVTKSGLKNGTVEYVKPVSKNLTKVTIPATVSIDGITYKVTSIAKNAFKSNKKLTKVTIGSNVKTIGASAFYSCTKLKTLSIGKNVTTIGDKAFYKCTSLSKVTIPSKVTKIGKAAFSGCTKLKTLTIGKNVTSIGDSAFYKCTSLTKVTIPSKVNKIGKSAFYGCKKLKTVTVKTTKLTTKNVGSNAFKGIYSKATIKVPGAKVKAYTDLFKKKGIAKTVKVKK